MEGRIVVVDFHVRGPGATDLLQGSHEVFHGHFRGGGGSGLSNSVEDAGHNLVSVLPGAVLTTLVAGDLERKGTG